MAIKVGTVVRLQSTGEVGVVVHTWHDDTLDTQDNYVAFFGNEIPAGKPEFVPYILRYLSSSLDVVE